MYPTDPTPPRGPAAGAPHSTEYASYPALAPEDVAPPPPPAVPPPHSSNPYIFAGPAPGPSSATGPSSAPPGYSSAASSSKKPLESVKGAFDKFQRRFEETAKKTEDMAGNLWQHLKTAPSVADAAVGMISQTTKVIAEGGYDKLFVQNFDCAPDEKLKKAYACYLSTSAGPIVGLLYLSTAKLAFASDNPVPYQVGNAVDSKFYKEEDIEIHEDSNADFDFISSYRRVLLGKARLADLFSIAELSDGASAVSRLKEMETGISYALKEPIDYPDLYEPEVQALQELNEADEDNLIVKLKGHFNYGHPYIFLELLGRSVDKVLVEYDYKLPMQNIRAYSSCLLRALQYVHSKGFIHCDVKPGSLAEVVGDVGLQVKLLDFSLATPAAENRLPLRMPTMQYRAPEIILGVGCTFASDIWSAACTIIEIATGKKYFSNEELSEHGAHLNHLAQIEHYLDTKIPLYMLQRATNRLYDGTMSFVVDDEIDYGTYGAVTYDNTLMELLLERADDGLSTLELEDLHGLLEMMLRVDPVERLTASEALEHRFFK